MYSTSHKISTLRRAKAQAVVNMSPAMVQLLRSKKTPKGDALEVARTAGLIAAKRTSELIPHCHPIPIDQITIDFDLHDSGEVTVFTTVTTLWKTGVEMEALVGAQIAAATLFDMLKPVSSEMEITNIRVLEKEGGKTSFHEDLPENFKAAVIVTSDGTAAGHRQDTSGQIIKERLETYIGERCEYIILPDEKKLIKEALCKLAEQGCHLVMTTGGTGLGPRDVTVEATKEVIDREIPGIMEAARAFGQERTPYAMLSRGVAGLKGKTIIINLPGSSRGTEESMSALFPAILHSYKMMAGGGHP